MLVHQRITGLAIALFVAWLNPVQAHIDYRNLDDHRPVRTEDAYPIERHAFELIVPYSTTTGGTVSRCTFWLRRSRTAFSGTCRSA